LQTKVVILDTNFPHNDAERRLCGEAGVELAIAQCRTEDEVVAAARDADGVIAQYAPLTRRSIAGLPRCRIISRYGIGVDNVDVAAATELGVWVANVPGFCAPEVSDHALALVLAFGRRLFSLDRSVRDGRWDVIGVAGQTQRLAESTLGVVGFGQIGRLLAEKAGRLGLRVLATSPRSAAAHAATHGAEAVDLERLLRESDYVVLLCPLTPQTRHLINRESLALMRPGAHLINVSRGALVDEAALIEALADGRLGGAGLDVFEREPPPDDSPLRRLPNVVMTPHAAYYSSRALAELQERVTLNVLEALAGRMPASTLNPHARSARS
jgi:D-3-phosphoglycerate dehydrogenase / 2-oxoglutarate reductase